MSPEPKNQAQRRGQPQLLLILLVGMAILMSAVAAELAFEAGRAMAGETSASGRISQVVVKAGENDELVYAPMVEFYTTSGERYEVLVEEWAPKSSYSPGQRVTVRYDPASPRNMRIVSFGNTIRAFTLTLITGALAIVFALGSLVIYRIPRSRDILP